MRQASRTPARSTEDHHALHDDANERDSRPPALKRWSPRGQLADGLFDDVALPTRADPGLSEQGPFVGHVEQGV